MDNKLRKTIENLKNNTGMAQSLMQSRDGQALMQLLTAKDGGAALQQAAQRAAQGDTAAMAQLLSSVMQSKEGAALVNRINDAASGK